MTVTPTMLGASQTMRDMLWPFDFDVEDNRSHGPVWIDVSALQPFEVVGKTGAGDVLALVGDGQHVLLLTSEGQAGIVAASLKDYLELAVEHPYWREIAEQADGELADMRTLLDDEGADREATALDDAPAIAEARPFLYRELGLGVPDDAFGLLHHALVVIGAGYELRDLDGQPMAPLFGDASAG
jgi:hypothetical protein